MSAELLGNLTEHRRLTTDGLQQLRELKRYSEQLGLAEVVERLEEVLKRIETDVFRVAVVGEFKRGKSTFINAMLGKEILPADVLPCSATLNRVTYGLNPNVRLIFKPDTAGNRKTEDILPEQLAEYVTKLTPDSELKAANIEEAIVYYPLKFCRDKADIIDTPGLNDDEAMTSVTMGVLPQVDAALFVILAQSPFSGYEADFLNKLLTQDLGRVLFIVNRIDEIRREPDRKRILQVVRDRIKKAVAVRASELHGEGSVEAQELIARIGEPRVFGVSGADALDARLNSDEELLQKSGFPAFEEALERFLAIDRGMITLLILAEAAVSACKKISAQATIRQGASSMKAEEFEAAYQKTSTELDTMRARLKEELHQIDRASNHLRDTLKPRAAALPHILIREAGLAIDAFPLAHEDVTKAKADETSKKMTKAVLERVQTAARLESERLQAEIEKGLQAELARLVDFGTRLESELATIELRFQPPKEMQEGLGQGASMGAGVMAGLGGGLLAGGALLGGAVSGAFSGYQVAGVKGALAGAAAGTVTGLGAGIGMAMAAVVIGLPLSWPVTLPIMALSGLASSLGARWFTRAVFSADQLKKFRDSFREAIFNQLESDSALRVSEVERAVDEQIKGAFQALRERVRCDLGGVVEQTQRTLDELRTQRIRSVAQAEKEATELQSILSNTARIEHSMRELAAQLRTLT